MANRFDNIPGLPQLYQQQSMVVDKPFIGTDVPDTPLKAPLDFYQKKLEERDKKVEKLDEQVAKIAPLFNVKGQDKVTGYNGITYDINEDKEANEALAPYLKDISEIRDEAMKNPSSGFAKLNEIQQKFQTDPKLRLYAENYKTYKEKFEPILAGKGNEEEKALVLQELTNWGQAKKQGQDYSLQAKSTVDLLDYKKNWSDLKRDMDKDSSKNEWINTDPKFATSAVYGHLTSQVGDKRILNSFWSNWKSDEVQRSLDHKNEYQTNLLSANINNANETFKRKFESELQGKTSAEQQAFLDAKLKSDPNLMKQYKGMIMSGNVQFGTDKYTYYDPKAKKDVTSELTVDGLLQGDKANQFLNTAAINRNNNFQQEQLTAYTSKFGKEEANTVSNVNWHFFNEGGGDSNPNKPKAVFTPIDIQQLPEEVKKFIDVSPDKSSPSLFKKGVIGKAVNPDGTIANTQEGKDFQKLISANKILIQNNINDLLRKSDIIGVNQNFFDIAQSKGYNPDQVIGILLSNEQNLAWDNPQYKKLFTDIGLKDVTTPQRDLMGRDTGRKSTIYAKDKVDKLNLQNAIADVIGNNKDLSSYQSTITLTGKNQGITQGYASDIINKIGKGDNIGDTEVFMNGSKITKDNLKDYQENIKGKMGGESTQTITFVPLGGSKVKFQSDMGNLVISETFDLNDETSLDAAMSIIKGLSASDQKNVLMNSFSDNIGVVQNQISNVSSGRTKKENIDLTYFPGSKIEIFPSTTKDGSYNAYIVDKNGDNKPLGLDMNKQQLEEKVLMLNVNPKYINTLR